VTLDQFEDGVVEAAKAGFTDYLERKLHRLTKLLTHYPPDSMTLHTHVEHFQHHNAFEVKLHLRSPLPDDCVSEATSHQLNKALDVAFDKLEPQVVRSLERLKE